MLTRIHINQHKIRSNRKTGDREAVITVKNYKTNRYGNSVAIRDAAGNIVAWVRYEPDHPLSCGAEVWLEIDSKTASVEVA